MYDKTCLGSDMDRFEISVRPFLTVFSHQTVPFSHRFFKSQPFFRTPPFLRTKNTLEILLFHHSLASSSLSGCFRLRNSASNTSKLTFANKMFSKFSNLYLTPQPALEFDLIGLRVTSHSEWLTNCIIQLRRAVA